MKKKTTKILLSAVMVTLLVAASAMPAFAAGDVAGAIEQTWTQAQTQIKTVVNNVVFPVVDMILPSCSLLRSALLTSITGSTGSLSLQPPASCSPA